MAVVDRPEGKKDWIVIDQGGQSHKLRSQRAEYTVAGGPYQGSDIAGFLAEVTPFLDPSHLEVAWELLSEDNSPTNPAELAQLLFSDQGPAPCYAAHVLLSDDKIFFKNKGDRYEPRPAQQVQEIRHQLEMARQKEQERAAFLDRLQRHLREEPQTWTEGDRVRLEQLERLVLQPELGSRSAVEVLEALSYGSTPEAAFKLLVDLGWWQPHENLFLRRSSYPLTFPKKVLDLVPSPLTPFDGDPHRRDLTHLKVYTIDDESTKEIDDGLSIEYRGAGETPRLWIHIADPSHLVQPGDELDLEARRRSTSLYLPTGMISMFPPELATGPMSLVQGRCCPALSFGIVLDETGAVQDYAIHSSLIKPTYRLTYDDVDEMLHLDLQAEPEIKELARWSQKRRQWRLNQGAISIQMPESSIKVSPEEEITIDVLEPSLSRELVAEMMILAGEVTGHYGQTHQLPLPFRGQPQPELPPEEELLRLPAGPVRACALRRCMPRSEMGITPNRHASLGLNTYTQVTSPIRRYADLLAHFQIKAHLRAQPLPFSADQLQEILLSVVSSSQEAVLVERQTNRYWSLEYLRRQGDRIWQALMLRWLREDEQLALVLLEDLGLELPHRFDRSVAPGEQIWIQVSRADPQRDEIRMREVLPHEMPLEAI